MDGREASAGGSLVAAGGDWREDASVLMRKISELDAFGGWTQ